MTPVRLELAALRSRVRLALGIEITSADANATIYQILGRVIVKKTTMRISGNEIMSIDDSDIYYCYVDL